MMRILRALPVALVFVSKALAQDPSSSPPSAQEKLNFFVDETFNPLSLGASLFDAGTSQATRSLPKYGRGWGAFGQRFGASVADIATQNLFSDYAMASLLHEDTRYVRKGAAFGFWSRFGHAAASSFVAEKDSGGSTFNWANFGGTAISTGVSNAYYPAASRNGGAMAIHFASSLLGAGLSNVEPEFWPDVHQWLRRHHLAPRATQSR